MNGYDSPIADMKLLKSLSKYQLLKDIFHVVNLFIKGLINFSDILIRYSFGDLNYGHPVSDLSADWAIYHSSLNLGIKI